MAVRRRTRAELKPDQASRARAIVHDHILAPALAQSLRHEPREKISATAGSRRNDDTHGPLRELQVCMRRRERC